MSGAHDEIVAAPARDRGDPPPVSIIEDTQASCQGTLNYPARSQGLTCSSGTSGGAAAP